jgi:hypothetical protein
MEDGGPWQEMLRAIFADSAVPMECCARTKQPVIVNGLHDGLTQPVRGVMNGWRREREEVVDVHDIGIPLEDFLSHPIVGGLTPQSLKSGSQEVACVNRLIIEDEFFDVVASRGQNLIFRLARFVLAASEFVFVVDCEYFQVQSPK